MVSGLFVVEADNQGRLGSEVVRQSVIYDAPGKFGFISVTEFENRRTVVRGYDFGSVKNIFSGFGVGDCGFYGFSDRFLKNVGRGQEVVVIVLFQDGNVFAQQHGRFCFDAAGYSFKGNDRFARRQFNPPRVLNEGKVVVVNAQDCFDVFVSADFYFGRKSRGS